MDLVRNGMAQVKRVRNEAGWYTVMNKTEDQSTGAACANAYALEPALILFGLVLLFCAYVCVCLQTRASLIKANDRSVLDLAIIERAREYAGECAWSKRCQTSPPPSSFHETIYKRDVLFRDEGTRIRMQYTEENQTYRIELYYDQSGIISVEYP